MVLYPAWMATTGSFHLSSPPPAITSTASLSTSTENAKEPQQSSTLETARPLCRGKRAGDEGARGTCKSKQWRLCRNRKPSPPTPLPDAGRARNFAGATSVDTNALWDRRPHRPRQGESALHLGVARSGAPQQLLEQATVATTGILALCQDHVGILLVHQECQVPSFLLSVRELMPLRRIHQSQVGLDPP